MKPRRSCLCFVCFVTVVVCLVFKMLNFFGIMPPWHESLPGAGQEGSQGGTKTGGSWGRIFFWNTVFGVGARFLFKDRLGMSLFLEGRIFLVCW